ncbi:FAD-dependent oxidoreductase [Angustibacter aerolatus]
MSAVIVVGGGVMGSSAAWHLAGRGHDVVLLEQFGPGHDLGSSHGSSRIFRLAYADPFYVDLAVRALPLWRRLEDEAGAELLDLTGALDHGPAPATEPLVGALSAAGREVQRLAPAEVTERWPGLRADGTAVFHPDAGRLHADDSVAALQRPAERRGAQVRHDVRVERVAVRGDDRVEVSTADETLHGDAVVAAVGGWAPQVLAGLPGVLDHVPSLRVTQEQPAHFPAAQPLGWPSFIHHGGGALPATSDGVYGLGSVDGIKVGFHGVGPVVSDPSHRDRSTDVVAQRRLQDYAARWLPGVDALRPTSTTCLYTTTVDHDFVVDRRGPVTVLAGFSGHGFKFGSVIGALAADLVEGRPGLDRFALDRRRGHPAPALEGSTA